MAPSRRNKNGLLLPLALTGAAAAASFALWYFLADDQPQRTPTAHESGDELERRRSPRRRSPPTSTALARTPLPSHKKSVALVVREGSSHSALLSNLPTPFPVDRANIYVFVYSPDLTAHPLSDSDGKGKEGRVYRQARKSYPKDEPKELVMPFNVEASLVPMLKQLQPEVVYIEASLVGKEAEVINSLMNGSWVGALVAAVEDPKTGQKIADLSARWGRLCRVLDVDRVGDDWKTRIN